MNFAQLKDLRCICQVLVKLFCLFFQVYEIQGRLGVATNNFSPGGKIIERSTYDHVTRASIDRIMSAIQSTYQREMYK